LYHSFSAKRFLVDERRSSPVPVRTLLLQLQLKIACTCSQRFLIAPFLSRFAIGRRRSLSINFSRYVIRERVEQRNRTAAIIARYNFVGFAVYEVKIQPAAIECSLVADMSE